MSLRATLGTRKAALLELTLMLTLRLPVALLSKDPRLLVLTLRSLGQLHVRRG